MATNGHGHPAPPILLTIAGFDPSCGAGTAADLKTFAAHGCYGVAAITSLTVQNTQGVETVHNTPSAELRAQLEALVKDCDIAAVKIGMLGNRGNAVVVGEFLDAHKFAPRRSMISSRDRARRGQTCERRGIHRRRRRYRGCRAFRFSPRRCRNPLRALRVARAIQRWECCGPFRRPGCSGR